MIYAQLFWAFLKIGAVSFGGGYGMIALIRETVLANAWMTEDAFLDFIAVSESTPGPLAVNMATFVGAAQGGLPGALLATLGVVLPAFIIILLIAAVIRTFLQHTGVQAFLSGVRPCIAALILATALTMLLDTLFGIQTIGGRAAVDGRAILILAMLAAVHVGWKRCRGRKPSPIAMILLSAVLGMALYAV